MSEQLAQVGVIGMAVMGSNLARNLARRGFRVAIHNRTAARTDEVIALHGSEGDFVPSHALADFVASLERPRRIILMVKAGGPTDATIDALIPLLEEGDIVVDGGNSFFQDTRRREQRLRSLGLHFVGAGISGGEVGALEGPSIMPGGSLESYEALGPILERIAADVNGEPCCTHIGADGAGHFVKMVHNGIEYADMQFIGEAYELLRALGLTHTEMADIFATWNTGDLDSYLIEITADVLRKTDPRTGAPLVDVIRDAAGMKGTGTWTVQSALDLGTPVNTIAESVFARAISSAPELRAAAQAALHGPDRGIRVADRDVFVEQVRQALWASTVVAYAQADLASRMHHPRPPTGADSFRIRSRQPHHFVGGSLHRGRPHGGPGRLAHRRGRGRAGRGTGTRLLGGTGALRPGPGTASQRGAHARTARLLRCTHLPPH